MYDLKHFLLATPNTILGLHNVPKAAVNQREAERIMQQQYDTKQQRLEAAHQQRPQQLRATAAQPARTSHLQPPIITNTPAQTPPQGFTFDNFVDPNRLAYMTQSIRIPQASAAQATRMGPS